jgi:CRP/FNR family transcriptional regulator
MSAVKPHAMTRNFRKHETIFRAGDRAGCLYEVVKGSLFVYRLLDDGRRQVVDFVRAGDICGFTDGPEHSSTCEALEAATLLSHERCGLAANPELQDRLLRQIDQRVASLHDHAVALGRKTAAERVATLLMRLVSTNGPGHCPAPEKKGAAVKIHMPMTRGEVADYLGLSLETVCRTLTDMERHGLIAIGQRRGEIKIANLCRLCFVAKTDVCGRD